MTRLMLSQSPSATCTARPALSPTDPRSRSPTPLCARGETFARDDRMIAQLRGNLIEKHPSRLIVDVGGVGYDVLVPLSTFYVVGDPGSGVTLRVHTHVREDVIALYGFATALEHDLFERLISVNGIGPKLALAVLSGIEPAELIKAI